VPFLAPSEVPSGVCGGDSFALPRQGRTIISQEDFNKGIFTFRSNFLAKYLIKKKNVRHGASLRNLGHSDKTVSHRQTTISGSTGQQQWEARGVLKSHGKQHRYLKRHQNHS